MVQVIILIGINRFYESPYSFKHQTSSIKSTGKIQNLQDNMILILVSPAHPKILLFSLDFELLKIIFVE